MDLWLAVLTGEDGSFTVVRELCVVNYTIVVLEDIHDVPWIQKDGNILW